jgi:hypothetical protein
MKTEAKYEVAKKECLPIEESLRHCDEWGRVGFCDKII